MRGLSALWLCLVTLLFTVLLLPREDLPPTGTWRDCRPRRAMTLVWGPHSTFGLASADLQSVDVLNAGESVLKLDSLDVGVGWGGVRYRATRQGASVAGTWHSPELTLARPGLSPARHPGRLGLQRAHNSRKGRSHCPDDNGVRHALGINRRIRARTSRRSESRERSNLRGIFACSTATLEFHAGLVGTKLQGHLDLTATRMTSGYTLGGTLEVDVNGISDRT